ncbi:MAG: aldehyde dehydrogenase family protein, partial [Nitrospirales bacterium]
MTIKDGTGGNKWSDDQFLDGLRLQGDAAADQCLAQLHDVLEEKDFSDLFQRLKTNAVVLSEDVPGPLSAFLTRTMKLPLIATSPIDHERIKRGQRVFMTHALPAALVLLAKSLPEGYAAPNLSKVLSISNNLSQRPYRRLLGVLQMLINVSAVGGFEPSGKALITVPKIRLLHAGVRKIVREHLTSYEAQHGVPVNLEDQLGTVMGFSYLVIAGLQQLRIGLSDEQAEDLFESKEMVGPTGEKNFLQHVPKGVVLCISPWNFPLAITAGQIIAALVTGNTVIAKPSEHTTIIAY